jgi:hypothetical protein
MTLPYMPYRFDSDQRKICVECLRVFECGECFSRFKGVMAHSPACPETSTKSLSRLFDDHGQRHGQTVQTTE